MARPEQTVKKGDLLVEFDAFALTSERQDQEIRVMKAEADLMTVEASLPGAKQAAEEAVAIAEKALRMATQRLEGYRTGEFPTQQTAAINEVVIAEERAAMWKRRSQEAQAACEEQGTKELEQELQETRLASSQADADLALARDRLKLLKEMEYPQRAEELELAIAQRKLDLLRARNELAQTTREGQANILIAQAIRQMESARSELLSEQIRASRLYAPRDGTVFSSDDVLFGARCEPGLEPGDTARPGQLLLRLSDLTQLKLEVRLPLPLAQKLAPGHQATVRLDAFPIRKIRGHVTHVGVLQDSDAANAPTEAIVTVRLDDSVKNFRPGLTAAVEFDTPK